MKMIFMFMLAVMIQVIVCTRCRKLIWKLLPLLLSALVEGAGWMCIFIFPNPSAGTVEAVMGAIFLGMYLLGGTTLGWFVWGVVRAVQKFVQK